METRVGNKDVMIDERIKATLICNIPIIVRFTHNECLL